MNVRVGAVAVAGAAMVAAACGQTVAHDLGAPPAAVTDVTVASPSPAEAPAATETTQPDPAPPPAVQPEATAAPPSPRPSERETAAAPAASPPPQVDHGAPLWGRTFTSTAVTQDGQPRALVDDTPITVTFEQREGTDVLRWQASCNIAGGDLVVQPRHLRVTAQGATDMGCAQEDHRQDRWLSDFFGDDPRWELHGRKLELWTDDIVIQLSARRT